MPIQHFGEHYGVFWSSCSQRRCITATYCSWQSENGLAAVMRCHIMECQPGLCARRCSPLDDHQHLPKLYDELCTTPSQATRPANGLRFHPSSSHMILLCPQITPDSWHNRMNSHERFAQKQSSWTLFLVSCVNLRRKTVDFHFISRRYLNCSSPYLDVDATVSKTEY